MTSIISSLTPEELATATEYLISTRDEFLASMGGLSEAQWNFKPDPESWSIAEILEHVTIVEERVHGIVGRMPEAPAAEPDRIASQIDEEVRSRVLDRSIKREAPPHVRPCGQGHADALARFKINRGRSIELLSEGPCLRGHVLPHPILGPWDGYQWILGAAAHSMRHADQIREVKSCPGYPN